MQSNPPLEQTSNRRSVVIHLLLSVHTCCKCAFPTLKAFSSVEEHHFSGGLFECRVYPRCGLVSCVDRTTVGFDRGGEAYGGSTPCSVFWPRCRRPPPHALSRPHPWPPSPRAPGRATHTAQSRRRGLWISAAALGEPTRALTV